MTKTIGKKLNRRKKIQRSRMGTNQIGTMLRKTNRL